MGTLGTGQGQSENARMFGKGGGRQEAGKSTCSFPRNLLDVLLRVHFSP